MDFFITFSLIFPWLVLAYFIFSWVWKKTKTPVIQQPHSYIPSQSTLNVATTLTTTKAPEFPANLHVNEEDWNTEENDIPVSANERVYKITRSIDQKNWIECESALTERSACNYAAYLKLNNPREYVRVTDPDGLILFYE